MSHAPTFHDHVLAHVGRRLEQRGYQFRDDVKYGSPENTAIDTRQATCEQA